jgi:hypothetical protein
MESDPSKINDADRQIEQTLWNEGQDYAARNARSKEENKGRAASRERVKQTGVNTNAYHTAVGLIKKLSARELVEWRRDFDLVLKVLGSRQAELFPEEALKMAKREADRQAKEAEAKTKAGPDADSNPRSDPNAGGAKPMTGDPEKPWPDDVATGTVQNPPGEAEEGDAALNAALPETKGKKKSQSQIAAEKAAAAGTDKPITVN